MKNYFKHHRISVRSGVGFVWFFACLLSFMQSCYAAPLHSGFFAGVGIARETVQYGFTRVADGPLLPGAPYTVHLTDNNSRLQVPEFVVGYQYLFGQLYLGAQFVRGYRSQTLNGQYNMHYQSNDGLYNYDYLYTTRIQMSDPMALDAMVGWSPLPSLVVYAEGGVSYIKVYDEFNKFYNNRRRNDGYVNSGEGDHINLHRIGEEIGLGAAYQATQHLQVRADYKLTNYGRMSYNAVMFGGYTSHKQFVLRTETASLDVVYTFG